MDYELAKILASFPAFLFASAAVFGVPLYFAIISYIHFCKYSLQQNFLPSITLFLAFLATGWGALMMIPKGDGMQYAASVLMWLFLGFWVLLVVYKRLLRTESKSSPNDQSVLIKKAQYAVSFMLYALLLSFAFYTSYKTSEWRLAESTTNTRHINKLYDEAIKKNSNDERDSIFLFITQNRRIQVVNSELLLKMLAVKPADHVVAQIAGHPSTNEVVACAILKQHPSATQYIKVKWNKDNCK